MTSGLKEICTACVGCLQAMSKKAIGYDSVSCSDDIADGAS